MKIETYNTIMALLDVMEAELDKIAEATGHISYKEFVEKNK